MKILTKNQVLTLKEYNLLVKAGYQLEPYEELCIVKGNDPFYRQEYEEMLRTAKKILRERKISAKEVMCFEEDKQHCLRILYRLRGILWFSGMGLLIWTLYEPTTWKSIILAVILTLVYIGERYGRNLATHSTCGR